MQKDKLKLDYIENENKLENVTRKEEIEGVGVVFDYIENNKSTNNIYVILKLHSLLYSKTPYKNFGGSFRNSSAYITNSNVVTSDPKDISKDISKLNDKFVKALKLADLINEYDVPDLTLEYLKLILDIKCRLIEIHPFSDGNGRTIRAFVNLMLEKINLNPVVIKSCEREIYLEAMNKAIVNNNKKDIHKIYVNKLTKR